MHIAIDTREACSIRPTGKGMWAKHVLAELEERHEVLLMLYEGEVGHGAWGVGRHVFWHWKTARRVWREKPDVYFSPTSYIVPWLLGKNIPTAVVIHDLIAFDSEPHDKKATAIERATLPRVLKTARWIFCVSEATKRDLLTRFPHTDPQKITVIYAGPTISNGTMLRLRSAQVEQLSNGTSAKLTTNNYQLKTVSPYILSIGTLCPRKNQLRLIQAFNWLPNNLKRTYRLILAGGRGWDDQEIVDLAAASQNVEWRGYVPEHKLTELLKNATLLAYPSLKEGFGFPVLDAMALGIPVLTSKGTSMEEVAGGAAVLADPMSTEEISAALTRLLTNIELQQTLIEKSRKRAREFSWRKMVKGMLETMTSTSQ